MNFKACLLIFFSLFSTTHGFATDHCELAASQGYSSERSVQLERDQAARVADARTDFDLYALYSNAGWNRFGGFAESFFASSLNQHGFIINEIYSQLAFNGNLGASSLGHLDSVVLAHLAKRFRLLAQIAHQDWFKLLYQFQQGSGRILHGRSWVTQFCVEHFAFRTMTKDAIYETISTAYATVEDMLRGTPQTTFECNHYVELIRRLTSEHLKLPDTLATHPRALETIFWLVSGGLKLIDAQAIAYDAIDGKYDWDTLLYLARRLRPSNNHLTISAITKLEPIPQPLSVAMDFSQQLKLAAQLRTHRVPFALFMKVAVSILRESRSIERLPIATEQLVLIARAIAENRYTPEQVLPFFSIESYWERADFSLEGLRAGHFPFAFSPLDQVIEWFGDLSPIQDNVREPSEQFEGYDDLFTHLTGRFFTEDLIFRFISGDLNFGAYHAVFSAASKAESVADPTK